jgi:hypothetical protein
MFVTIEQLLEPDGTSTIRTPISSLAGGAGSYPITRHGYPPSSLLPSALGGNQKGTQRNWLGSLSDVGFKSCGYFLDAERRNGERNRKRSLLNQIGNNFIGDV